MSMDHLGMPTETPGIIEDACQALGSKINGEYIGSRSTCTCFSFFDNKIITSGGEGGAVVFKDVFLSKEARLLRQQGKDYSMPFAVVEGFNMRMTDLQACVGVVQLDHLKEIIEKKRKSFDEYSKIDNLIFQEETSSKESNRWLCGALTDKRDEIYNSLKKEGARLSFPPIGKFKWLTNKIFPSSSILYERGIIFPPFATKEITEKIKTIVE